RIVNALSKTLGINLDRLQKFFSELSEIGEVIRQRRVELGRSPVSYVSRCADFLHDWINLEGSGYAKYVKVEVGKDGRKHVWLGIKCLDPALASSVINDLRSVILMSGTLWHADYYVDVLGIERGRYSFLELPSPFPPENRLLIVDRAVTTKFERRGERQWKRIAGHLTKIIQKVGGSLAFYFPSYEIMQEIVKLLKTDLPLLVEEKHTNIKDVFDFLDKNKQNLIFGVARGKISEGVDMSTEGRTMLSAVIIVGLPYPKKTELQIALYKYFKEKFGNKAIEYANDIPCLNALAQSAGRLLRSPEDRGIIVIMDGRAAGKFKWRLPQEWRDEMNVHVKIEKILEKIESFYNTRRV
ncbi:MAG: helicase C-terminal domain-containing protein, partial [Candidatus Bathycorpusculaceae bacterium]